MPTLKTRYHKPNYSGAQIPRDKVHYRIDYIFCEPGDMSGFKSRCKTAEYKKAKARF